MAWQLTFIAAITWPDRPRTGTLNELTIAYAEARQDSDAPAWFHGLEGAPAAQAEFDALIQHLEEELERGRFFHPADKAPVMKRNLRTALLRARMSEQEVRTMRGVIKALAIGRGGRKLDDG